MANANNDQTGFARFMAPVLEALRELGGSARSSQVKESVIARMGIPESQLSEVLANGVSRIGNQIDWARFYLVKSGYLASSKRGVWTITEQGKSKPLNPNDVKILVRKVNATAKTNRSPVLEQNDDPTDVQSPESIDHKQALLATLRKLPAKGFEELCRYLLLEAGFEEVTVTGQSGDGGIDGHGILRVNKLVSMTVLFQCKRFKDAVVSSVVRDFRGALSGRAEKGIILTTGYFTASAEQEAHRDGVVPIELVDGNRLIELFEEMEIGLINPRRVFDVDDNFFDRFRI